MCRVLLFGIDSEFVNRLLRLLRVVLAVAGKFHDCSSRNRLGVVFKVTAQIPAIITSSESVSTKRDEAIFQPGSQLVRERLYIIGCRDNWTLELLPTLSRCKAHEQVDPGLGGSTVLCQQHHGAVRYSW